MDAERKITQELKIERKQTTTSVWNICTCGRILHSVSEAERGTCASCWIKSMKPTTRNALNRVIASAFNGSSDEQKQQAVNDAFDALDSE